MTLAPMGLASPITWWKSVRVSRSSPQRVYAAGYQVAGSAQVHLERSDNGGQTREPPR